MSSSDTHDGTDPTVDFECIICTASTDEIDGCCSSVCARQAERELKRNAGTLMRSASGSTSVERRRRLAERNGKLFSALVRWRPANEAGEPA